MRIVVIGGTRFLGRHFVERARDAGHEVTVFHRGRTTAPDGVRVIVGDRRSDLAALPERIDAIFDTCAYRAADVATLADALHGRGAPVYALVTSVSVYAEAPVWTEDAPLLAPQFDDAPVSGETYGPMKAACEQVARERFGASALILRPGSSSARTTPAIASATGRAAAPNPAASSRPATARCRSASSTRATSPRSR